MKERSEDRRTINKLILFLCDACNLRCNYCYVLAPDPCRTGMMREATARGIARRIFSRYQGCNFVQFFGGEPSLNMTAMRAFVEEIQRMLNAGQLARPPRFGIVTNGASPNSSEMVAFCKEHNIGVTVSIDGHKPIHDALRPTVKGAGTFDATIATIESLHNEQLPLAIETVYTSLHIDRQCSIVDLLEFARDVGAKKLIFHTAYPPAPAHLCPFDSTHFERLREYHREAVDWWFESLLAERTPIVDIYFKDLLLPLLQGAGAGVAGGGCPAGLRDFSVAPNGDTYSCHLLYGNPKFYLGNILGEEELRQERGLPIHTGDLKKCTDCFARHWCQPCGALNSSWGDAWIPAHAECELRRAVILRIGEWAFKYLAVPKNPTTEALRRVAIPTPA